MPNALTISDIGVRFRSREISPVELLRTVLESADRVQQDLNAFVPIDREPAFQQARESERRWLRGAPLSLLDGVPVAVKDNHAVAGQKRSSGSLAFAGLPPATVDASHIARLRQAGAIFFARTTMPDLAWKAVTDSPLTGVTRNPWNRELTPGGSSGGSAVAVATGCCPLATGSDGGGSIRIPAAFTGIYGLKPTTGRIPGIGESPDITAIGPLTRTVRDAALALATMCRPDAGDPLSAALAVPDFERAPGLGVAGLRVAVSANLGHLRSGAGTEILDQAAAALSDAGAEVRFQDPPVWDIRQAYVRVCEVAFGAVAAGLPSDRMSLLDPGLLATARRGMTVSAVEARLAELERIRLIQAFADFFCAFDLLLTPCVPIPPFRAGSNVNTPDESLYPEWYDWTPFTWPINAAKLPAASCPWGLDSAGLPQAVQLVASHFREDLLLRASAVLEAAMPYPAV